MNSVGLNNLLLRLQKTKTAKVESRLMEKKLKRCNLIEWSSRHATKRRTYAPKWRHENDRMLQTNVAEDPGSANLCVERNST